MLDSKTDGTDADREGGRERGQKAEAVNLARWTAEDEEEEDREESEKER